MSLKIIKADATHYQYFKPEILNQGVGYIVSSANAVVGLFSYLLDGEQATLSFTFVFDKEAIKLAVDTFLNDYPDVKEITYLGNQNLSAVGFKQKKYQRS